MATARIRTAALSMDPQAPGTVPANSMYFDSANSGLLSQKNAGNVPSQLAVATANDLMIKVMENLSGVTIPAGKPVSKKSDGSILAGDALAVGAGLYVGVTLDSINSGSTGRVLLVGPNVAGALTGLGFTPGQDIYLNENGGYSNNPGAFVGNSDAIIKVGVADCAGGAASGTVTDLIMFPDVVSRP